MTMRRRLHFKAQWVNKKQKKLYKENIIMRKQVLNAAAFRFRPCVCVNGGEERGGVEMVMS